MLTLSNNDILLPQHHKLAVITNDFLQKHRLVQAGWKLEWEKSKKYLGKCYFQQKIITLSIYWGLFLPETETKDTILHEIAHALTWEQFHKDKNEVSIGLWHRIQKDYLGHGVVWQQMCKQIGAKPQKCYDGEIRLPNLK